MNVIKFFMRKTSKTINNLKSINLIKLKSYDNRNEKRCSRRAYPEYNP